MQLKTSATIDIAKPRAQVFDIATNNDTFVRHFGKYGPIPGVTRAENEGGVPLAAGIRRQIGLTDGATIVEEVLEYEHPRVHRYRWVSGLKPPLSLLVRWGEGRWDFSDAGAGTHVEWRYTMELRSILALPIAAPVLMLFRGWMRQGLRNLKRAVE